MGVGLRKTWIHINALVLVSCVQLSTLNYPGDPRGHFLGIKLWTITLYHHCKYQLCSTVWRTPHPTPHHAAINHAWMIVFKFNVKFHSSCHVQTRVSLKRGIIWGICIYKGEMLFFPPMCTNKNATENSK